MKGPLDTPGEDKKVAAPTEALQLPEMASPTSTTSVLDKMRDIISDAPRTVISYNNKSYRMSDPDTPSKPVVNFICRELKGLL